MKVYPEPTQGPEWLGAFLMNPPLWFKVLLIALALAVLGLAARSLFRRDLYISPDEQRSIALILATALGVALGVVLSMWLLPLDYLGDVAVGLIVGFVGVEFATRGARVMGTRLIGDETLRMLVVWQALIFASIGIPVAAELGGGSPPPGIATAGAFISAGMFTWTMLQEVCEGETVYDTLMQAEAGDSRQE